MLLFFISLVSDNGMTFHQYLVTMCWLKSLWVFLIIIQNDKLQWKFIFCCNPKCGRVIANIFCTSLQWDITGGSQHFKSLSTGLFVQQIFQTFSKENIQKLCDLALVILCERIYRSWFLIIFTSQRVGNAENVSMRWNHHVSWQLCCLGMYKYVGESSCHNSW